MKQRSRKKGFTLIEVILFLAISSAILVAILSGTSSSLARQRYNDSVQDLYSFLQSQYSDVIDTQNPTIASGGGRSDYAIYGKLLVFENSTVKAWDIIGKAVDSGTVQTYSDITSAVNSLELKTVRDRDNPTEIYTPQWGGTIEEESSNNSITASVVIIRSPINGTVYTYKADDTGVDAIQTATNCTAQIDAVSICGFISSADGYFSSAYTLANDGTSDNTINLCLNTEDQAYGNRRRNIRISNTNTVDAIRLIPLDDEGENKCI